MKEKKEKKEVAHKKSPASEVKNDVAAVPIPSVPKSSNRMNFHEKVSFPSRKNDEQEAPKVEQLGEKRKRTAGVITANAHNDSGLNTISSSSSGPHFGPQGPAAAAGTRAPRTNSASNQSDETWNAKCSALAEYCRVNQKLPPQKNTIVDVEGIL